MNEPQFTQGEREIVEPPYGFEVHVNGEDIARVTSGSPADLHLIRSAPELYQELLDRYTQTRCGCGHPACGRCWDDKVTESVLARARGEDVE